MMTNDEQYDRVARYLDGENLALSPEEQALAAEVRADEHRLAPLLAAAGEGDILATGDGLALAAEIRRDQAALAGMLDADVPPATVDRAWRRTAAALARPQRRLMRLGIAAASAAAVAAALLLAFALDLRPPTHHKRGQHAVAVAGRAHANGQKSFWAVPLEVLTASMQEHRDPAIEMVAQEIDELEADSVAAAGLDDLGTDRGIDQIQRAVEEFWTDDVFE